MCTQYLCPIRHLTISIISPYFIATITINMQAVIFPRPTLASSRSSQEVKFPEDIQVILRADRQQDGNLYMGNIEAAENAAIIQNLRIGAVMSVAKGRTTTHPKELVPHCKCIPVEESQQAQLGRYLQEGVDFIAQQLRTTNVLVHCVSGTNRSSCFVIAFLIRHHALSLQDAYNEVKSRRKVISLSEGMLEQLRIFERGGNPRGASRQGTSVRQDRSIREDASGQRSIRVKTKLPEGEDWERRSYRSNKSGTSKVSQQMSALNTSNIAMRNPEESFISKNSKAPSILNKSFRPSQRCPSQVLQLDDMPELPELRLQRKASSSREQFTVKIRELDSKNSEINNKIFQLHQRFDQDNQTSRLSLETQLNEISQLRSSLFSERKSRLSRIAHEPIDYPQITTEP